MSGHQQDSMTQGHQDMKVCFSGFLIIKTRLKHTNANQMSFSFCIPIELFCIHSQENVTENYILIDYIPFSLHCLLTFYFYI